MILSAFSVVLGVLSGKKYDPTIRFVAGSKMKTPDKLGMKKNRSNDTKARRDRPRLSIAASERPNEFCLRINSAGLVPAITAFLRPR